MNGQYDTVQCVQSSGHCIICDNQCKEIVNYREQKWQTGRSLLMNFPNTIMPKWWICFTAEQQFFLDYMKNKKTSPCQKTFRAQASSLLALNSALRRPARRGVSWYISVAYCAQRSHQDPRCSLPPGEERLTSGQCRARRKVTTRTPTRCSHPPAVRIRVSKGMAPTLVVLPLHKQCSEAEVVAAWVFVRLCWHRR